jgi:hypothetical protein
MRNHNQETEPAGSDVPCGTINRRSRVPGTDRAWAAGVFESSGSIGLRTRRLQLNDRDPELVERFHRVVGGKLFGPYASKLPGRGPRWLWSSTGVDHARIVIAGFWPYLGTRTSDRAIAAGIAPRQGRRP